VGGTIALLELHAKRQAFATGGKSWAQQYEIFDCLLRAGVASAILRPLAEGLALFGEYDATPKKSPQLSTTLVSMMYCFGLPVQVKDDKLFPWLATLQTTRRTPEFCRRKASVLQRPFSCEDAYLPGYLTVKNFWGTAVRRSERFSDTDLFLSFLRRFFYEDPRFVSVILDPGVKEVRAATRIVDYFIQRVNAFLSMDLEPALVEWLAEFESPRERTLANLMPGLGATEADFALANERMLPLWNARSGDEVVDGFVSVNTAVFRKVMHVGSVAGEVRMADDARTIWVDGSEILRCDPDQPAPAPGVGELSVVWDPETTYLGVFFVGGGASTLVKAYFPGKEGTSGERAGQLAQFAGVSNMIDDRLRKNLREVMDGHGAILQTELERMRRETVGNAESIYGELATLNASAGERETILSALRTAGLGALLGYESRLVEALAAVGLANTITHGRGEVAFVLSTIGIEDEVRDRLFREYAKPQGLPVLAITESVAMALI